MNLGLIVTMFKQSKQFRDSRVKPPSHGCNTIFIV